MATKRAGEGAGPYNPFVFARPVRADEAIARREDVDHLVGLAEAGHNAAIVAPRRYGKTSLIGQVNEAAEKRLNMVPIVADLSDLLSVDDLAIRLEQAYRGLKGPIARHVSEALAKMDLELTLGKVSVRAGRADPQPLERIHALLDLPRGLFERTSRRALVTFDEFQELSRLNGMPGVLRSHLQHQGEVASFVFAGSEPSMLRALFADRAKPFYGQAELFRLPPLHPALSAPFVTAHFEATGREVGEALPSLLYAAAGHPQRLMLLAHLLWAHTSPGGAATVETFNHAFEEALRRVDPEMRAVWDGLELNERRVLTALASGLAPTGNDALRITGLKSRSAGQTAVERLLGEGVLQRGEDGKELWVVDPLLERWARRRGGARPVIYVIRRPDGSGLVTEGPSLAFARSTHRTVTDAEAAAQRLLNELRRPGDIVVYDVEDPNDLPTWALLEGN